MNAEEITQLRKERDHFRMALLNIAATGRKWAVAQGGNTPLAIVAGLARTALDMDVEEVDKECAAIRRDN